MAPIIRVVGALLTGFGLGGHSVPLVIIGTSVFILSFIWESQP